MWQFSGGPSLERVLTKWPKKYYRERTNCLDNLDTYQKALNKGARPGAGILGFVHSEPLGVVAIDQKGPGAGLKQFRLYVYPDEETKIIHFITLGDKNNQREDIQLCRQFVGNLRKEKAELREKKENDEQEK